MAKMTDPSPQYTRHGRLLEKDCPQQPDVMFDQWFHDAAKPMGRAAEQMVLGTVDEQGHPHQRIVLLKEYASDCILFYTNYQSLKSQNMAHQARVSLLFWWPPLQRQLRIEGVAKHVDRVKSEAYFATRIRESQLAAWASPQSEVITDDVLLAAYEEQEKRFAGVETIPCPDFWGGVAVVPDYYEFWQGSDARLHDRIVFQKDGSSWKRFRLSP